jgi:hypothetical protein
MGSMASGITIAVTGPHGRTLVLRATSNTPGDVVAQRTRLRINPALSAVAMKTFVGPEVPRTFQRELSMDSLAQNFE